MSDQTTSLLSLANKVPEIEDLLSKAESSGLSKEEQQKLLSYLTATKDFLTTNIQQQITLINTISSLQAKQEHGILSEDDTFLLKQSLSDFLDLKMEAVNLAEQIQQNVYLEIAIQKQNSDVAVAMAAAKQKGTLNYAEPADLGEFINRTQILNMYSRNRVCDDNFKKTLIQITKDTQEELSVIDSVLTSLKTNVLG